MSKLYCINCGLLIPSRALYCPQCGAPQHGPEAGTFRASEAPVILKAAATAISGASSAKKENKVSGKNSQLIDIPERKLSGNAVWSFFFSYIVKTSILLLLLLMTVAINPLIFLVGFTGYIVVLFIVAEIAYSSFSYGTDEVGFQKRYGVIHKMQVTIPYKQIQNVNIRRSLMDRILGLSHVSIETAGNASGATSNLMSDIITTSEGYLPGLNLEDAKQLHDSLLTRAQNADSQ